MSQRQRINRLERQEGTRACPGPPLFWREGTRAELDAMPPVPDLCELCGKPLSDHPGIRVIEVVHPGDEPLSPDTPFVEEVEL